MPLGYSSPFITAAKKATEPKRTSVLLRTPTVAPTGAPRQVRQGDYIVTYSPTGSIISRVYSPVSSPRANSTAAGLSAGRSGSTNTVANAINKANQNTSSNPVANIIKQAQSNSTNYGGALGQAQSVGASSMGSPDVYAAGTSGSSSTGGSGSGGTSGAGYEDANSGITYTGAFKGINDKQADYMVANPLAIAQKVFGIDMANNPTIAGLLSPLLEAAQNPYIGAVLNPGQTGVPDQNNELNFAANLLKQYTQPGGSFLSPTAGLQGIQSAMGNPNSALNAVLSTATGEGAAGAAAQYDLFTKIMAPFLSLGTGAWGSDIFDSVGYDAYNKYTLGQAATPGLPKQDFMSALMAAYGFPGTLK